MPRRLVRVLLFAAALAATFAPAASARTSAKPTIVLVHGAFADASGFGAVTDRLQDRGYTVISPANPLRGPAGDAAYVASVMQTIEGPIVLVAHSYGGAVSTLAANQAPNVKALVYLNALAMDAGESNLEIIQRFPNEFIKALQPRPFPQGVDLYIDPTKFRALFAPDVPARTAARMASAQRPLTVAASEEKVTEPAWKRLPSWYLIGAPGRRHQPRGAALHGQARQGADRRDQLVPRLLRLAPGRGHQADPPRHAVGRARHGLRTRSAGACGDIAPADQGDRWAPCANRNPGLAGGVLFG